MGSLNPLGREMKDNENHKTQLSERPIFYCSTASWKIPEQPYQLSVAKMLWHPRDQRVNCRAQILTALS